MKNYKKSNITKLKFIRVNQNNQEDEEIEDEIVPNTALNTQNNNHFQNDFEINKPTYKKFEEINTQDKEIIDNSPRPQTSFKLPKFLMQREDVKSKLDSLKKSSDKMKQGGNLPFTPENFGDNPNSFTSVFKKDNDQKNGSQRVFRKSMIFMILQLLSFVSLSVIVISGVIFGFTTLLNTIISIGIIIVSILLYTVITSLFYIIVADRSYIWISLLCQSLSLILLYSFVGQGFGYPTLILATIIMLLSYFAYLEIEKIQVSTRFFSVGYITGEAIKILSTIGILTICLGIFNIVLSQTPGVFLSRNIVENEFIFKNTVINSNRWLSLNSIFGVKSEYKIVKDTTDIVDAKNQTVLVSDFIEKNYPTEEVLTNKEISQIKAICTASDKECNNIVNIEKNKKLDKYLVKLVEIGQMEPALKLTDTLNYKSYKKILKAFYSDKINDFETQKVTQSIPYLSSIQWIIEPSRNIFIPAIISLLFYIALLSIKFLIHFLANSLVWIIWKLLLLIGFVKIDIELVESEIVSI